MEETLQVHVNRFLTTFTVEFNHGGFQWKAVEMTKILVMFTNTGTSGGVFTGLCFQLLRVHVYRAQNWCVKPWNHENSVYVYN